MKSKSSFNPQILPGVKASPDEHWRFLVMIVTIMVLAIIVGALYVVAWTYKIQPVATVPMTTQTSPNTQVALTLQAQQQKEAQMEAVSVAQIKLTKTQAQTKAMQIKNLLSAQ